MEFTRREASPFHRPQKIIQNKQKQMSSGVDFRDVTIHGHVSPENRHRIEGTIIIKRPDGTLIQQNKQKGHANAAKVQ
jgi:hypothetical protein